MFVWGGGKPLDHRKYDIDFAFEECVQMPFTAYGTGFPANEYPIYGFIEKKHEFKSKDQVVEWVNLFESPGLQIIAMNNYSTYLENSEFYSIFFPWLGFKAGVLSLAAALFTGLGLSGVAKLVAEALHVRNQNRVLKNKKLETENKQLQSELYNLKKIYIGEGALSEVDDSRGRLSEVSQRERVAVKR